MCLLVVSSLIDWTCNQQRGDFMIGEQKINSGRVTKPKILRSFEAWKPTAAAMVITTGLTCKVSICE